MPCERHAPEAAETGVRSGWGNPAPNARAPQEVAVCFGARLMRGNRVQKVHSSAYRAFDSLTYPPLATLGVDVEWGHRYLLQVRRPPPGRRRVSPSTSRTLTAGPPVLCTRP
jgi:L-asparaginase/Glu-tRNA(Gln) amidotransferase subunit D